MVSCTFWGCGSDTTSRVNYLTMVGLDFDPKSMAVGADFGLGFRKKHSQTASSPNKLTKTQREESFNLANTCNTKITD
ncbi:hypothetical protein VNO77_04409 [Canavalia gladiata]|uniref:Uncharacterized protein n=1 Tax=Canavalia gladiata TaxID=3824 RepID=A0AAN9R916_CANGL